MPIRLRHSRLVRWLRPVLSRAGSRRLARVLVGALLLLAALGIEPAVPHAAAQDSPIVPGTSFTLPLGEQFEAMSNVWVYVPRTAQPGDELQVLVALHGMGGKGSSFAAPLVELADRHRWLLVSPDLVYRDWRDPNQVRSDDIVLTRGLLRLLDVLPERTGWETRDRVLLFGFSRGAQVATRFSLFYPEEVIAAAALSAGTYTLPRETWLSEGRERILPLPFGVGDLWTSIGRRFDHEAVRQLHFWVAVGANDNSTTDSPPAWTPYLGVGRVNRAESFVRALQEVGIDASLRVYEGIGHGYNQRMLTEAIDFLKAQQDREAAKPTRRSSSTFLQPLAAVERLPLSALPAPAMVRPSGW